MAATAGRTVTGLDVGSTSVKAVRVASRKEGALVVGAAIAELPDRRELDTGVDGSQADPRVESIREVLEACGTDLRRGTLVSVVGGPGVSIKHVSFPAMSRQALAESIRWEARKHVPFGDTDFVLDFQLMDGRNGGSENDEKEMQVILAAVERSLIDEHVALLGRAGVEPMTVDLVPLALINELDEERLLNDGAAAVIELGATGLTLSIYRRGGFFFARSIPMGSQKTVERERAAAEAAADEDPEVDAPSTSSAMSRRWLDLALKEIRRSLTFYNNETGKQGIEMVYLTGGRALTPGIAESFEEALGVRAKVLNPLGENTQSTADLSRLVPQGPRFAVAMGLARREPA